MHKQWSFANIDSYYWFIPSSYCFISCSDQNQISCIVDAIIHNKFQIVNLMVIVAKKTPRVIAYQVYKYIIISIKDFYRSCYLRIY